MVMEQLAVEIVGLCREYGECRVEVERMEEARRVKNALVSVCAMARQRLDNYCGAVCHLLFSAISRYAEKEITIYEKVLILCNSSDQHLCFVRKMSIYYV